MAVETQHQASLPVGDLADNPYRISRPDDDLVDRLAAFFREGEPVEPLTVLRAPAGTRYVVDGHARRDAARQAGLAHVPASELITPDGDEPGLWQIALTRMLSELRGARGRIATAQAVAELCRLEGAGLGDNDTSTRAAAARIGMPEATVRTWLDRAQLVREADAGRSAHTRDEIEAMSVRDVRAAMAALRSSNTGGQRTAPGDSGYAPAERALYRVAREDPDRAVAAVANLLARLQDEGIDLSDRVTVTQPGAERPAYVTLTAFNRAAAARFPEAAERGGLDRELAAAVEAAGAGAISPSTVKGIREGQIRRPPPARLQAIAAVLGRRVLTAAGKAALGAA